MMAARGGHWEVVRLLLESKGDVNVQNSVSPKRVFQFSTFQF
jgi:ankyrin repeat protein